MANMTEREVDALEALVDKHSLAHVLHALADIAFAKAEHIRAYWQDRATAKVWDKVGERVERTAEAIDAAPARVVSR